MIIDMHCHPFPPEYARWFEKKGIKPALWDMDPLKPDYYNIESLINRMNDSGVSISVITTGQLPWVDTLEVKQAVDLAKVMNDGISTYVEKFPDRLVGFATLPYLAMPDTIDELRRAVRDLGLKGIFLPSNIVGNLVDMPQLVPLYAEISKLGVPILVHPTAPEAQVNMTDYRLIQTLGYTCNTTLAVSRLILGGILERFKLKIIAAHAGGVFPYIIGRMARAYEVWPSEVGRNISKNPREYFREVYVDQISFNVPSTICARDTLGIDRMLFGTDYPFGWGSQTDFVKYVRDLPFSYEEKQKLFSINAAKILHLK